MKLIMTFEIGDGYTFNADVTIPIEYKSAEAAIVDFETIAKKTYAESRGAWPRPSEEFVFAGHKFHVDNHFGRPGEFISPRFPTVDEWFEEFRRQMVE